MLIGVPKEIKTREYRVGINPGGVVALTRAGHQVLIEKSAGLGAGISDAEFIAAGAKIVPTAADAWAAEMVMKVKEPLAAEYAFFRPGQILFTYLHLAPLPELTRELMTKKVRAIAYETVQAADGSLPLLRPMSEVAGRMATQVGASSLQKEHGGKGVLLGGVPGTRRGRVTILGGGVVGAGAARVAVGMGAQVTLLDVDHARMSYLEDIFGASIETLYSNPKNIEKSVVEADLVIGAVLVAGARAPKLVDEDLIKRMSPGSVVVDVAVDQGGCIATCKPTTHDQPTFVLHDVVHYCVANMPGAVAQTSTFALTNVTLRYAELLANLGAEKAVKASAALAHGVNCWDGACTYRAVAEGVNVEYTPIEKLV